jgi:hypothetical protein
VANLCQRGMIRFSGVIIILVLTIAKLWDSNLGYMMEHYEVQWPMMVYMVKYLTHSSRAGQRKRKKASQRPKMENKEREERNISEEGERVDADTEQRSSGLVSLVPQLGDIACHSETARRRYLMTPLARLRLL